MQDRIGGLHTKAEQCEKLVPMTRYHEQDCHQRNHLQKAMHMLLDRSHIPGGHRVTDIPQGCSFVDEERNNHDGDDPGVYLQKDRCQQR